MKASLVVMGALGIASGCDLNDADSANFREGFVTIYSQDFEGDAPIAWFTNGLPNGVCKSLAEGVESNGNRFASSSSPWWLDENHAPPGLGFLNLVAFAYHADWGYGGEVTAFNAGRAIDLRNAELLLRWRAPDLHLPSTTRLVFWFQTRIPQASGAPKFVNYVLTGQPLLPQIGNEDWQTTTLRFKPSASEFECLGSRLSRLETYGCANSVEEALQDWNVDLGFVILMPDMALTTQISGRMEIDAISLRVPWKNLATHVDAPVTLSYENRTCLLPDPPAT